jgi:hypothetical protein
VQLSGQERHVPAAPDDPAAAGEPSGARRAQELHVQVGGGREEARTQRGDQRRTQGVVEHRRQEPALDHPGWVQELLAGGERDLDSAGLGIDRDQLPPEQDGRGRRRGPAFHHIPERPLTRHPAIPIRARPAPHGHPWHPGPTAHLRHSGTARTRGVRCVHAAGGRNAANAGRVDRGADAGANLRHLGTTRTGSYDMNAAFMLLQVHGWDIHAV